MIISRAFLTLSFPFSANLASSSFSKIHCSTSLGFIVQKIFAIRLMRCSSFSCGKSSFRAMNNGSRKR